MANELNLLLLLSSNSRRKRQIKQRTHPLEVQEAIPAGEYNDIEAAGRDKYNIIDIYRRYRRQHNTAMLWIANLYAFRGLRIVRNMWNDEWSDIMAKRATHGRTQPAKQSAMSYNQAESSNKGNQQDRCSLCLGRSLERRRKCNCGNFFFHAAANSPPLSDARKRNHLDIPHHTIWHWYYRLCWVYNYVWCHHGPITVLVFEIGHSNSHSSK